MKAENLRSVERTELVMVRWMCGVSLEDRKQIASYLGICCVADVAGQSEVVWASRAQE